MSAYNLLVLAVYYPVSLLVCHSGSRVEEPHHEPFDAFPFQDLISYKKAIHLKRAWCALFLTINLWNRVLIFWMIFSLFLSVNQVTHSDIKPFCLYEYASYYCHVCHFYLLYGFVFLFQIYRIILRYWVLFFYVTVLFMGNGSYVSPTRLIIMTKICWCLLKENNHL